MADDAPCPGCGIPLVRAADHGVRYQCGACGGRLMGLSPFEQMLQEGQGAHLWVACQEGVTTGPCPFCHQAMRQAGTGADAPTGLAMCHICQQVWIPSEASEWLGGHAAAASGSPVEPMAALPPRCDNCGAPFQVDAEGCCRYCHTQLIDPEPVVVNFEQPAVPTTGSRLLDDLVGLMGRAVSD